MISDKVRPHHLQRKAILYVRQSSAHQVLHNRESSALQYAMRDRLMALGLCALYGLFIVKRFQNGDLFFCFLHRFLCSTWKSRFFVPTRSICKAGARRSCQGWPSH